MLYQDQRKMIINQNNQEKVKLCRPRSISNNAISFHTETQQQQFKTDLATNHQTSISEIKQFNLNQRNNSFIQGVENNTKIINQQHHYDFYKLMKNFHSMQYTNKKQKDIQNCSNQDKNKIVQVREAQSQEKQSKIKHNSQTREIQQDNNNIQELLRLNKTETINSNNLQKNENNRINKSNIRERMKNYPQKSSSPQIINYTRPKSSMEDKSVTIMSLQLKDMKENIQSKDIQQICYDIGYHAVKFERDYDKINNIYNGQGWLQIRGNSNDNKFMNLQTNLSKKGINLGDQNQNLKDFIPNKYLLKKQEHSQMETQPNLNQDEKLFNNFLKFQKRKKGQFI
ncbi:unnamed protein product [Paramecium primaurelia]|uniref:Uncharacterized protein n=1 Tax=Paramecium primaurelia TaxID=5886 RepID=A0A8S1L4G9_PARPR|nr:unnamed protein product [Paramecium primaurelia]